MRKDDYTTFTEKYHPHEKKGWFCLRLYETFGEDLQTIRETNSNNVWTLVDGDNGKLYIIQGYHLVNRVNYLITDIPHNFKARDYLYG